MSDDGGTVATSGPDLPQVVAGQLSGGAVGEYLRVPFKVGDQTGEVVVGQSDDIEPVSPRVAQALVEMIINEMTVIDRLPNQHEAKNKLIFDLLQGACKTKSRSSPRPAWREPHTPAGRRVDRRHRLPVRRSGRCKRNTTARSGWHERRPCSAPGPVHHQQRSELLPSIQRDHLRIHRRWHVAVLRATNTKNLTLWVTAQRAADESNSSLANLKTKHKKRMSKSLAAMDLFLSVAALVAHWL